ncbi:MAG: hypothetical protein Q4D17_02285 [Planctomycetia bacterium]|nr:hypothetical protein [Planctomycetia bacterium]
MTPFEDLLFFDSQRAASPADALTILHFSGHLDFSRLENAIREIAKIFCVAGRIAVLEKNGTLDWSKEEFPIQIHHFLGKPTSENLPDSFISILEEPGIRFWIYEQPEEEKTQIWFQFHHLTTDALGSFLFLNRIFELYSEVGEKSLVCPQESEFRLECQPRMDAELKKNAFQQVFSYLVGQLNIFKKRSLEFCERPESTIGKKVIPSLILPKEQEKKDVFSATMPVLFQTFSHEETRRFLDIAHREGVSLNDLLLAAAFLACARVWKKSFGRLPQRPVLVAVPVSLRKGKFQKIPLRNLVSVVFLMEKLKKLPERRLFLQRIHQGMRNNSMKRKAELLLLELKWLCALRLRGDHRWGMKRFCRKEMLRTSFVFSNLGILFRSSELPRTSEGKLKIGSMILERVEQASPRTTNAALTIAAGTYAGRLHLGINHDPGRISDDTVHLFLRLMIEELKSYQDSFSGERK